MYFCIFSHWVLPLGFIITDRIFCVFFQFRRACSLTNDTLEVERRPCPNNAACNRGPVEITVDGNVLSGMFCDLTWYNTFSGPPPPGPPPPGPPPPGPPPHGLPPPLDSRGGGKPGGSRGGGGGVKTGGKQ